MSEKVITTKTVYEGGYLKVYRDEVLLESGKSAYREYIRHPGAAMVIPILNSETVLMVKQYRHAVKQFMWEFPAGKRDAQEDLKTTALRELKEEAGCTTQNLRYLTTIHPVIGYADEEIAIYVATDLTPGTNQLDEGEELTVHEVPIAQLFGMLRRGELSDVKTQIGVFWLEKILQNGW